jgi:hypothetical protein
VKIIVYIENKLTKEEVKEIIESLNQKDSDIAEAVEYFVEHLKNSELKGFKLSYSNKNVGEYFHHLNIYVKQEKIEKNYTYDFPLCLEEFFQGKEDFLNWYEEEICYVINELLEDELRGED